MMNSPKIIKDSWGRVSVEGQNTVFKDAKLWPGGSREWDGNETGTSHTPGIQPEDVTELIENGAEVVILSQGRNKRLQIKQETLDWLDKRNVETYVFPTDQAIEQYNSLTNSKNVGALIHSTC